MKNVSVKTTFNGRTVYLGYRTSETAIKIRDAADHKIERKRNLQKEDHEKGFIEK